MSRQGTNPGVKVISRRDFLKSAAAVSGGALLAACAPSATETPQPAVPQPTVPGATPAPKLPYTISTEPVTLKGDFYLGGYGEDWFRAVGDELKLVHPNISTDYNFDALIDDSIRPKILAGNPADMIYFLLFDMTSAALEGNVLDLTPLLEAPAYLQEEKKVKDIFIQGALVNTYIEGKPYLLPMGNQFFGLWYDQALFEKMGWQPPKTFDEMTKLFPEIKTAGMYPLVHQGIWPFYMQRLVALMTYDIAGYEHVKATDNLEPGSWDNDAVRQAIEWIQELLKKDYIHPGSPGMDVVPAQMEFIKHNAAFVVCGDWLKAEMQDAWPSDFRLMPLTFPHTSGGKGKPGAAYIQWQNLFCIPAKAAHPNEAFEFSRIMYSKKMENKKAQMFGAMGYIQGASEGVDYEDWAAAEAKILASAPELYTYQWAWWYTPMRKDAGDAITNVFTGKWGFEEFAPAMEAIAAKYKKDQTYYHRTHN